MPPLDWVKKHHKSCNNLAKLWRLDTSTIWKPVTGRAEVSYAMQHRFYEASNGQVRDVDWFKLRKPNKRKARKAK